MTSSTIYPRRLELIVMMMLYRMDPDDVQGTLYAYSGCLQRRFGWYLHELFGVPSAPFIPSAPSTGQFSYVLSGLGTLSDLDILSGIGTLSSPAPSVALGSSAAQCP